MSTGGPKEAQVRARAVIDSGASQKSHKEKRKRLLLAQNSLGLETWKQFRITSHLRVRRCYLHFRGDKIGVHKD